MQGVKKLITAGMVVVAIMTMAKISSASLYNPPPGQPWGQFHYGAAGTDAEACDPFICDPLFVGSSGNNSFLLLGDPPWEFTGPGFLIVQDVFLRGDRFEVFDVVNNITVSLGLTRDPVIDDPLTSPGTSGCNSDPANSSDPVVCFADPGSSHRVFTLGDFAHSFTIKVNQAPDFFDDGIVGGVAYLCIDSGQGECGVPINGDTDIPEPTSMLLLGLGLVVGSFWARRDQLNLKFALQRALAWRRSRQRKKLI